MPNEYAWSIPPGVQLRFSTAADGDMKTPAVRARWLAGLPGVRVWVTPGQVHSELVIDADADDLDRLAFADGVVSQNRELGLGVFGSDCPGLCISTRDTLGVAHCGWRGLAAGILEMLVYEIEARTADERSDWSAFIGPGISGPRYEVDGLVLQGNWWPPSALQPRGGGKALLDLRETMRVKLTALGISDITNANLCTAEADDLHSYRHQGPGLTQLLVAWRT